VAEPERVRTEIAFKSGQTVSVNVTAEVVEALEQALAGDEPASVSFDADDGRYTVVVRMIAFVKRHVRESRVGFGAG
jgi:acid phosphatase class B